MDTVNFDGVTYEGVMPYSRRLGIDWRTLLGLIARGVITPQAQLAHGGGWLFSGATFKADKRFADAVRRK